MLNGQGKMTWMDKGQPKTYEGNFTADYPMKKDTVGLNEDASFADWKYRVTKVETFNSAGNKQASGKFVFVTLTEQNNGNTVRQPGSNDFFILFDQTNGRTYRMNSEASLAVRLANASWNTPWIFSKINPGLTVEGILFVFDVPKDLDINNLFLVPIQSRGDATPIRLEIDCCFLM